MGESASWSHRGVPRLLRNSERSSLEKGEEQEGVGPSPPTSPADKLAASPSEDTSFLDSPSPSSLSDLERKDSRADVPDCCDVESGAVPLRALVWMRSEADDPPLPSSSERSSTSARELSSAFGALDEGEGFAIAETGAEKREGRECEGS